MGKLRIALAGTLLSASVVVCATASVIASNGSSPATHTYRVPSGAMEPTLSIGEIVSTVAPGGRYPLRVGAIVVFHPPRGAVAEICGAPHPASAACDEPDSQAPSQLFIKRIVAGPGDLISIVNGQVIRNGRRESDRHITPCAPETPTCELPTRIRIPAGMWFMLGDNRGQSDDSRFWGPVPSAWITGVVTGAYQPQSEPLTS